MVLPSLSEGILLLEHYKYILIFPISVLEGPIITVISGLLVSLKILNPFWAFVILVIGDLVGDVAHYYVGSLWGDSAWIKKWGKYLGYNEKSEKYLVQHFDKHMGKTFFLAKLSHGIGGAVLVAAGIAKVDMKEFIWYNTIGTIPKTIILMLIGYYIGDSYMKIDTYLNSFALITVGITVVLIIGYIVMGKASKKYFSSTDSN